MVEGTKSTDGDGARFERIEENLAFAERSVEQLSEEIADMNRRVQNLVKRLETMEERLEKALEPPEDPE